MILKSPHNHQVNLKSGVLASLLVVYALTVAPVYSAHLCLGIAIASMLLLAFESNWTRRSSFALFLNLIALALCLGKLIA